MKNIRLGLSPLTEEVYAGEPVSGSFTDNKVNVTNDFRRLVVTYCSEEKEFEVDGMKFRATCERID
ncbi:hypothetical protein P8825_14955 [Shouchella clausii]|uniref:DUF7446 family protein n=1 Tax=Shouchella clausii TaxID=79880 RepID=UPI002DB9BD2B|nr:hypothetical protein [Shouchella clausii]MEB5480863.1 hypothetical protein [Shouchella clausii]